MSFVMIFKCGIVMGFCTLQAHEGSLCSLQGAPASNNEGGKAWPEAVTIPGYDLQSVAEES